MPKNPAKLSAAKAMQEIYNLLFLDMDAKGDFLNPGKECWGGTDFYQGVNKIVTRWKAAPAEPEGRPVEGQP